MGIGERKLHGMDSVLSPNGTKRPRPGRRLSLRQVVGLQEIAYTAALGLGADFQATGQASTTPVTREQRARAASAIANLAKAWTALQDSKREILGRPRMGVLKPRPEDKRKRHYAEPEPVCCLPVGDGEPANGP